MPAGRLRVLVEQGRAQAVQGQGLVPGVAEFAVGGGGLAVEVGGFRVAVETAVDLARTVPRERLCAAVAKVELERGGASVGDQGLGEVAGGLLGVAESEQPVGLQTEVAEAEGDVDRCLGRDQGRLDVALSK
ncbi:hypothetical protein [Streptomyces sp. DSM 40750]|uniref:hypothetical protein n=1 Tax=Streptomyces sp. DSM 40750 TaxID=2801030 RepID=UPI00214CA5E6|nr:hypothetical protein [Streptomyces sp. DSM 40750]UUU23916.1 hypothetical protein JIX55_28685 [Streptomyces sp. DSM 40750]